MERFAINNIQKIDELKSELEYERATSLYLKLRKLEKEDSNYIPIRKHLRKLILQYEQDHWSEDSQIEDNQIEESDLAESLVQTENEFYQKRKELIREKLEEVGLNQNNLAKILGHRKGYMSELINGLRPFSKEDLVIIHRLFGIKLENLVPPFIKQDKAKQVRNALKHLSNNKIKLSKKDFDLHAF
jgi:plasmid maintenance system antidote protein VapI